MSEGKRPAGHIKMSRKDGTPITYRGYKGDERTDKYAPVATLWPNRFGSLDVTFEKGFNADPEKFWYTYFPAKNGPGLPAGKATPSRGRGDDPFGDE